MEPTFAEIKQRLEEMKNFGYLNSWEGTFSGTPFYCAIVISEIVEHYKKEAREAGLNIYEVDGVSHFRIRDGEFKDKEAVYLIL